MPRFRFKIVDSQGRHRKGILTAESLEAADVGLRSKLCTIEELTPLEEEGSVLDFAGLESRFSQLDWVHFTAAALAALAFCLSLFTWVSSPSKTRAPDESDLPVRFTVTGALDTHLVDNEVYGWKVIAVFPEVPFEAGGSLDDTGAFSLDVHFQGRPRPERMMIDVSNAGRRWRQSAEIRVPSAGELKVGKILVDAPEVSRGR